MNQLITEEERKLLLAHGQARAAGRAIDPLPVVRLFTPDAHATWLLVSLDPADGDTAHGLIDLGIGMPELGEIKLSDLASIAGPRQQPVVRLFTPDAHATWLLVSLDPADGDTAHGLIDLGIGMPELGEIKLSDLASIVGPRQQPVMRDRYFQAVRPLSEYLRLAQENGSVVD